VETLEVLDPLVMELLVEREKVDDLAFPDVRETLVYSADLGALVYLEAKEIVEHLEPPDLEELRESLVAQATVESLED